MSRPGSQPRDDEPTDAPLADAEVETAPTRLADFELLRDLGLHDGVRSWFAARKGGFGFTKRVLLKAAARPFREDPGTALRIIEEARIGMRLHHPNLLSVLDMARDGDTYFLVREWVDGAGLRAVARAAWSAGKRPSVAAVLRVGVQVARALAYLHGLQVEPWAPHGVVHRAVTPSNILLSAYGEVRLATLSIAARTGAGEGPNTSATPLLPAFAAPEALLDTGQVDPRADLFSLGAVLYEALIGPGAFDGSPDSDWSRRRDPLRIPGLVRASVLPERLRALLLRLLAEVPAERPSGAVEVRDILRRVLREDLGSDGEDELRADVSAVVQSEARRST